MWGKDVNWVHVVDKGTLGQVCLPSLQFPPFRIIPSTLRTHSSTRFSYQKDKWARPGNLPPPPKKKQRYFGNRGGGGRRWIEKYFQFFFLFSEGQCFLWSYMRTKYAGSKPGASTNFHLHRVQFPGIGKGRPQHNWTLPSNVLTNVPTRSQVVRNSPSVPVTIYQ